MITTIYLTAGGLVGIGLLTVYILFYCPIDGRDRWLESITRGTRFDAKKKLQALEHERRSKSMKRVWRKKGGRS